MADRQSQTEIDFGTISSDEAAEIFPLPLSPWEEYLIADDAPHQPMTFFAEAVFSGPLDRDRLTRALHIAVHRNPMLASRLVLDRGCRSWQYDAHHRPRWLSAAETPPVINGLPRSFDLTREPGARYWYDETNEGSRFLVQVHHSVTDGVGLRHFFVEVSRAYALLSESNSSHARPMNGRDRPHYSQLLNRFGTERFRSRPADEQLTFVERLRNMHYFFFQKPTPLAGSIRRGCSVGRDERVHPYLIDRLTESETERVLEGCSDLGVALSEVATSLLLKLCCEWNEERGVRGERRRIRVLLPYDLRDKQSLRMSAANKMSYAFIGRTHSQCRDWSVLLSSVRAEMQWIKRKQVIGDFWQGLEGFARRRWMLKGFVRANRNMAGVVLTYAGDFYRGADRYFESEGGDRRVGDSLLMETTACPPIRSHTNAALCLALCRGRLYSTINWNPAGFTRDDAALFLRRFLESFPAVFPSTPEA